MIQFFLKILGIFRFNSHRPSKIDNTDVEPLCVMDTYLAEVSTALKGIGYFE